MDNEVKEKVMYALIKDYEMIYDRMTFIPDIQARVRAANGIMVYLSQVCDYGKSILPTVQAQPTAAVPSKVVERATELQVAPSPTPQPNRIDTPPYDMEKKRWNYCEVHPGEEIKHFSEKTKRYYYACLKCQEFLQADGSRKPMGVKE